MIVKYYYQIGGLPFDKQNPMIIPMNVKQQYFSKEDLISILTKDKAEISKLESIRYRNKKYNGWIEVSDKTFLEVKGDELELLLILKEAPMSVDLQYNLDQLLSKLNLQDKKIHELEQKLVKSHSLAHQISHHHHHHNSVTYLESSPSMELVRTVGSFQNPVKESSMSFEESRLDISFLYSNPLVKDTKFKKDVPVIDPIDFESEINCLVDIFKSSEKKITARFDVANDDNLNEIIRKRPKILHISCHGAYEEVEGVSKFFLYFEDQKGKLDKYDIDRLASVLGGSKNDKPQIEVVFVSACYSEPVAEVFRQAKVPAVICVHSATKILDEAAQKFAKTFYNTLLDGETITGAFNQAKKAVFHGVDKTNTHCCCSHNHKPECRWKDLSDDEAHTQHLKMCGCNFEESHFHKRDCRWALQVLNYNLNIDSDSCKEPYLRVCCCSPEIAHDESNKFMLKIDRGYDPVIFANIPGGVLEIKNKSCCLNVNFSVDMKTSLIGRNVELYNVFNIFSNHNLNKNRLITVYGGQGVGKNSFVKLAGKYMYERKCFPDGIHYINNRGQIFNENWFIGKISSSLDLNTHNYDLTHLCKTISHLQMLVIFNFSLTVEESMEEARKIFKFVLEHTRYPKFLISTKNALELETYESKIVLEPLNSYYAAKLLFTLAGEHLPQVLKNDLVELTKHEIIKLSKCNPGRIHQIAGLLHEQKKFEKLLEQLRNEDRKRENLTNDILKLSLDKLGQKTTYVEEILYLLNILPDGILQCEIISLFANNYKEIIEILEDLSTNSIIVVKSNNKDLKQIVYHLSEEIVICLETQLNISEEIKLAVYKKIVIYYSGLMRNIVNNLYNANENLERATEFSAAQNEGLWLTFNQEIYSKLYKYEKIFNPAKRYNFNELNILSLIKVDNKSLKLLIHKDKEVGEAIEQLTICIPTILKLISKMNECVNQFKNFTKLCEEYKLELAEARLYLFKMSLYPIFSGRTIHPTLPFDSNIYYNIVHAISIFEKLKFEEGEAEANFVRAVISNEMGAINSRMSLDKEIKKEFDTAIDKFNRVSNLIGVARVKYIFAEYLISNKHYPEIAFAHFQDAMKIFSKFERKNLIIKCLLGISKWFLGIKNEVKSMEYAKQAQQESTGKNINPICVYETKDMIAEILEYIRIKSFNVFVFIKAHQLVKTQDNLDLGLRRSTSRNLATTKDLEIPIEPLINHYTNFREKMIDNLKRANKEIHIKFDYLTENNFKEILTQMGRVLHLSSDEYSYNGSIFVEGENGESCEIPIDRLKEIVSSTKCSYELVIVAIPQSKEIAQVFIESGVQNVVCFEFDEEFIQQGQQLPSLPFNLCHDFSVTMLSELINENTLERAYQLSLREFEEQIEVIRTKLQKYNLKRDFFRGDKLAQVHLLPENKNHDIKLFDNKSIEDAMLFDGQILDLSKNRARLWQVKKRMTAFIGRKRELYNLSMMARNMTKSNLVGKSGCGKTFLIKELCYFLYTRNYFRDGIFYFDVSDVKNIDKIQSMFQEAALYSSVEENLKSSHNNANKEDRRILVVFDNTDKLIKFTENKLFLYLDSVAKDSNNIHYLFSSNKEIKNINIKAKMELTNLTPKEAQLMFLYYCPNIEESQIDIHPQYKDQIYDAKNLSDLIGYSSCLNACQGIPKFIKKLADIACVKSMKRIDKSEFLPKKFEKRSEDMNDSVLSSKSKIVSFIQGAPGSNSNTMGAIKAPTINQTFGPTSSLNRLSSSINNEIIKHNETQPFNLRHSVANQDFSFQVLNNLNNSFKLQHQGNINNLNNLNNSNIIQNSYNNYYNNNTSVNNSVNNSISQTKKSALNSSEDNIMDIRSSQLSSGTDLNKSVIPNRNRRNKSEIPEQENDDDVINEDNSVEYEDEDEDIDEEDDEKEPIILRQIKDCERSRIVRNEDDGKNDEKTNLASSHGPIIIQNVFNYNSNNSDYNINYRSDSRNSKTSRNSFRDSDNSRLTDIRMLRNTLHPIKSPFNFHEAGFTSNLLNNSFMTENTMERTSRINKTTSNTQTTAEAKKKKGKKRASGKMFKKFGKKVKNKYMKGKELHGEENDE
jgi:ABC-type Fe3+/spermidine/putrescine transport system ATPase subunit